MIGAIIIMGAGIAFFKLSAMGNDPSSAMCMAIGDTVGLPFSTTLIIANSIWFISELILGRKYVGVGTFFNWFCVGIFADLWAPLIQGIVSLLTGFSGRLVIMFMGVLILSFSCALYQTANMGNSPYDALSIVMADRLPLPYFWCRIITDSICAIVAYLFGGIVGVGTLFCALGLGPFINFFTEKAAKKILAEK